MATLQDWQNYINDYEQKLAIKKQELDSKLNNSSLSDAEKKQALEDYTKQESYLQWLKTKRDEYMETGEIPSDMTLDITANGDLYQYNGEIRIANLPPLSSYTGTVVTLGTVNIGTTRTTTSFEACSAPDCNVSLDWGGLHTFDEYTNESLKLVAFYSPNAYAISFGVTINHTEDPWVKTFYMAASASGSWATETGYTPSSPASSQGESQPSGNVLFGIGYNYEIASTLNDIPTWSDSFYAMFSGPNIWQSYSSPTRLFARRFCTVSYTGDLSDTTPWDFYNDEILLNIDPDNAVFPNGYNPISSPLSLSLWSIKETKDDIKVANVFPYNHDAGDGTFFAQVHSKIKYDTLTRDENSEVIINGLRFEFEDAVRKSSWRDGAEEPEPYLLATYNFGQINSVNFNSGENVIPKGEIQIENFPSELDRIIDLKNNELIQGSYLGEVISYFNVANTQYQVNLNVLWKYKPGEQPWNGKEIIRVRRKDGTGIPEEREVRVNDANSPAPFVLEPYDDNGNLINYIIECQIFDEQQHLDDDWSICVDTYEINYEDRRNIINIFNSWNKINYEIDQLSNTITLDIKFNTKDFVNPFDFISYMKGTYTSIGKNPVHDWENIINKSGYLSAINDNQIGFFCAKYTYTWGNEGECFTILPYLTIVIKNQNNTSINTFEINAKEQEGVFNPLARDMNKNSVWNDENLDWPYYSKRNYDSQGNYQLGAESTRLFGRKGFYKISEQEDKKWTNADDTDFIADYYENNIGELHIGEPSENSHNEYEIINNDFVYSIIKMDEVNQIPYLYNFCIFIIDNNTSDAQDVRDIIPYYYCASITEPIRANKPGKITATIHFNEKSNNYWNMSAPTTGGQYIQNYLTHKAHKPFDECIYSVMISGENPIIYSVNKPVLLQAAISMPDIPNNWLETKYPIYN